MTDARDAVEDLARNVGWWRGTETRMDDPDSYRVGWHVMAVGSGFDVWRRTGPTSADHNESLTTPEALLMLHLARLGPIRERCPDCEGAKRQDCETSDFDEGRKLCDDGWECIGGTLAIDGDSGSRIYRRPCPTCTVPACSRCGGSGREFDAVYHEKNTASLVHDPDGPCVKCEGKQSGKPTGWVTREHGWAERWLRARPQECKACLGRVVVGHYDEPDEDGFREPVLCGACEDGATLGDPKARVDLTILADDLQGKGVPLGVWLALWLAGKPCETCDGSGSSALRRTISAYFDDLIGAKTNMSPDTLDRVRFTVQRFVDELGDGSRVVVSEDMEQRSYALEGIDHLVDCEPCHGTGLELGHHTLAMAARPEEQSEAAPVDPA